MDSNVSFALNGALCLGFRQLDNEHWPAAPLFTLTIINPQLARNLAGDNLLRVKIAPQPDSPARWSVTSAELEDGSPVPTEHLQLKLNTLIDSATGATHYWIDSGSVFA